MTASPERRLWAAAAALIIGDAVQRVEAARKGWRSTGLAGDYAKHMLRSEESEIAAARRYFASKDWHTVAACAGLDATPEEVMRIVTTPGLWKQRKDAGLTRDAIREREKAARRSAVA